VTTILVTGASTGIGYATALRLSKNATVFAGVRSESDYAAMGALGENIVPVYLEVTDRDSIARAKTTIAEKTGGRLDALVNNAGIVVAGPLELIEPEQFERQFAVNVMGPLYVSQAFLPMIRAAKGRIVTIGSIGGKMSMPYVGPYSASKFAIEAMTDALRIEMLPFGVKVILIEPGAIKTPLWQRTQAAGKATVAGARYGTIARSFSASTTTTWAVRMSMRRSSQKRLRVRLTVSRVVPIMFAIS
jgi:NAD(P)-dependent dehydrogenase (short-subunit alcohol dehydrogenase family)